MDRPRVIFFFPYRGVGGVSVLFAEIAKYCAVRFGWRSVCVDFADGYMAGVLRRAKEVELIDFEVGRDLRVGAADLLVMQSTLPYNIRRELKVAKEARVVFWTLHALNLVQAVAPFAWTRYMQSRYPLVDRIADKTVLRGAQARVRGLVKAMIAAKAIFFMDGPTLRSTERHLQIKIPNPTIIPLVSDFNHLAGNGSRLSRHGPPLRFGWLGRLCDFKIHILVHTIERLSRLAESRKERFEMHVIGDGPEAGRLQGLNVEHAHFRLVRAGPLCGKERDEYMAQHYDVLFAMGMAACDGAKLHIPTVLLGFSYQPIKRPYRYRWLFEVNDFSLGEEIGGADYDRGVDSLNEILEAVQRDWESLAAMTYQYYVANHSIDTVCERFRAAVERAEFRFGDIRPEWMRKGSMRLAYEFWRDGIFKKGVFAARK